MPKHKKSNFSKENSFASHRNDGSKFKKAGKTQSISMTGSNNVQLGGGNAFGRDSKPFDQREMFMLASRNESFEEDFRGDRIVHKSCFGHIKSNDQKPNSEPWILDEMQKFCTDFVRKGNVWARKCLTLYKISYSSIDKPHFSCLVPADLLQAEVGIDPGHVTDVKMGLHENMKQTKMNELVSQLELMRSDLDIETAVSAFTDKCFSILNNSIQEDWEASEKINYETESKSKIWECAENLQQILVEIMSSYPTIEMPDTAMDHGSDGNESEVSAPLEKEANKNDDSAMNPLEAQQNYDSMVNPQDSYQDQDQETAETIINRLAARATLEALSELTSEQIAVKEEPGLMSPVIKSEPLFHE